MTARRRTPDWLIGRQEDLFPESVRAHLTFVTASGFSSRTLTSRRVVLRQLFVAVAADPLHLDMDELVAFLSRPDLAPESRATYFGHLSAFYKWAVDSERIARNPMSKMVRPRVPRARPRPVLGAELDRLLAVDVEPWRTAILLAAYAGLRASEIAELRREDVTEHAIRVHGKGGRVDEVPTHPRIWAHVRDRGPGHLVRRAEDGQPFAEQRLSTTFAVFVTRKLGMPRTGLHRLRHAYATRLLRAGTNIRVVQELMRHNNLATTARYTAVDENERRQAIGGLS